MAKAEPAPRTRSAGPFALIGVAALGAAVAVHLSKLSSRAKNGQGVGVTMA